MQTTGDDPSTERLLARNARLHWERDEALARIRQLEDALAVTASWTIPQGDLATLVRQSEEASRIVAQINRKARAALNPDPPER